MSDELENLIRFLRGPQGGTVSPSAPPTEECLTYRQAERIARDTHSPEEQSRQHIEACAYCSNLLEHFDEALSDDISDISLAPGSGDTEPMMAKTGRPSSRRIVTLRFGRWLALAASILIVVGAVLFLAVRGGPDPERSTSGSMAGTAEALHPEEDAIVFVPEIDESLAPPHVPHEPEGEIALTPGHDQVIPDDTDPVIEGMDLALASGLMPKGPKEFASGEAISIQLKLNRDSYVVLINVDSEGALQPMRDPASADLEAGQRLGAGTHELKRWVGGGPIGTETIFAVASEQAIPDFNEHLDDLRRFLQEGGAAADIVRRIDEWPAEVVAISFQHVGQR